ncbi:hypothetical protein [Listeria portnoyi]|uniref:hypothetical protein n=1 Tax=Listeria portnoyi TaxID=2713504 RepID=UPI001C9C88F6|nr:hypothetical protein [Listeria portnoyi]
MNPVTAFTIIMLIWAISDFVSKKTKSLISSLLVASIIVHIGTMISIDAYGLMMLAILIIIFGPLATSSVDDLVALIGPLCIAFAIGVSGSVVFSAVMGKILGYSVSMSIAIGLTTLYGFPGTMILSQEAARSVGENEQENEYFGRTNPLNFLETERILDASLFLCVYFVRNSVNTFAIIQKRLWYGEDIKKELAKHGITWWE